MLFAKVILALACAAVAAALPHYSVPQTHLEVLRMRANTEVNPSAVLSTECLDSNKNIVFHDQNVAELGICGGISGSIKKCSGNPSYTTGESGSAKFMLNAVKEGATINISKGRWEECVRAARAVCPTGSLQATCSGGATSGDVAFTLDNP